MSILRYLVLMILSVFISITLSVAIIGYSAEVLLYPEVYVEAMDGFPFDEYVSMEQQIAVDLLRQEFPELLKGALAYIRGDTTKLNLTVDMRPHVRTMIEQEIDKLPECDPGVIPQDFECIPPNIPKEMFIEEALKSMPSEVDIGVEIGRARFDQARDYVALGKRVVIVSFLASIALLGLVAYLTRESARSMAHWLDYELMPMGIGLFAIGYFSDYFIPDLPREMQPLQQSLTIIMDAVFERMQLFGIILFVIAVFIWIGGFVVSHRHKA